MPGGRSLPIIAVEASDAKENLSNLLLGRTIAISVHGLQHQTLPSPLLPGEPPVLGDAATMKRREKATNGFDPVETLDAERDDGDDRRAHVDGVVDDLEVLAVSEGQTEMCSALNQR